MDLVPEPEVLLRSFFVFEHRCLSCYALAIERHPLFKNVQFVGHASRNDVRVFIAAIGAFLSEVERWCAVLLRMFLFDCDVCVSSWRRGMLSKVVQVSCQLRKHVVWCHASVMICVSSNVVMSFGNIIIGHEQGLCARYGVVEYRDVTHREAK